MLRKLTNIGIKEEYNLNERKRIKLLNRIVVLFSAFVSIKFFTEIIVRDLTGMMIAFSIIVSFMFTIVFHYYEKLVLARAYFITMMSLIVAATNIIFGHGFGSEFGFFPIIIAIIIFFNKQSSRLLWILFFLIFYGLSNLFLRHNEAILLANLSQSTFYYMFLSCAGAVFLAASFFMNQNKKYEEQTLELLETLKTKNEGLETANKELERFAYVASHDLKTPLRNINSFLNLIQRKIKKGQTEEISEYLEFAILNAKRMYNLIEDILEFSRFTNGEVSFQKEDLNEIIMIAINDIEEKINSKNVIINYPKFPAFYCNKTQMVSLFQNLIGNGIKYNESEIPVVDISYENDGENHIFSVMDNGIGIEEEYQEKIFDMFYRLHNQGEYEGSGIGLSTCKKIVTYHGGEIQLESEINKGSRFTITLPQSSQVKDKSKME